MGPFPFYRFEAVVLNAGFYPLSNFQSDILNSIFNEFSEDDLVGLKYFVAINEVKSIIDTYNLPINGGDIVVIPPKPFPPLSGIQTLVYKVANKQLLATNPDQFIEVELTLLNGVVTANTYSWPGSISETGNFDSAVLSIEKEVIQALNVYDKSGASFFNPYYKFDRASLTATSGLIRAKDWAIANDAVNRTPLPTNPFGANDWIPVQPFLPEITYILAQFGQIVQFGFDSTKTISDIETLANSYTWPEGFTLSVTDNGTDKIEITLAGTNSGAKLIGNFDAVWTWQRFYTDETPVSVPFITVVAFTGEWPFEPNTGRFFQASWCDIEDLTFDETKSDLDEGDYLQPVKSGDLLKFNIVPELANLAEITSCEIGIFDCEGNFIQKVGSAQVPGLSKELTVPSSFFSSVLSAISLGQDLNINADDCSGSALGSVIFIDHGDLSNANINDFAQSVVDGINAISGYSATFQIDTDLIFYITHQDSITQFYGGTGVLFGRTESEFVPCLSQLQASVMIPALAKGVYYLGLYNSTGYVNEVYSFSNAFSLNNNETFSQIIEIGSPIDQIIEGFEYYNGWVQRIRVNLNGAGQTYTIEESIYRNSDGSFQKPQNSTDENISLHTDYLDLSTQRAMTSATRHPLFVLRGQNLSVQGDLEIATVQDYTTNTSFRRLQQMKFSAKIQGYQPSNNACIG